MPLYNRYYIMRHGESEANRDRRIVSDPATGVHAWGLTARGTEEVRAAVESFFPRTVTCIYSSDFARARETALVAAPFFGVPDVAYTPLLRERFFGDFDGRDDSWYEKVWKMDRQRIETYPFNIESPDSVRGRVLSLLESCEKAHRGEAILLVSHGDTLQILMAVTGGLLPGEHRSIPHLERAEIREIVPAPGFSLQEAL